MYDIHCIFLAGDRVIALEEFSAVWLYDISKLESK
jgi:hypothetical protein